MSSVDFDSFSVRKPCAALMTFALKAPARPLSPLIRTMRYFSSPRGSSSGCENSPTTLPLRSPRTSFIFDAKGRAAVTRSCDRFSLAAATIFIALVICCVFLTDLMRRRMSKRLGICLVQSLTFKVLHPRLISLSHKRLNLERRSCGCCSCFLPASGLKVLDSFLHGGLQIIVDALLFTDRV